MTRKHSPTKVQFVTYLNSCKGVQVVDYGDGFLDTIINGKRAFIEPLQMGARLPDDRYIRYIAVDSLSDALMGVSPAFIKRTYKEYINGTK